MIRNLCLTLITILTFSLVQAEDLIGEQDYRISLLRAAPGNLSGLLDQTKEYRSQQNGDVIIMRHDQGDHWDLLLLEPAGKTPTHMLDFSELASFQHSFLASSTARWPTLNKLDEESGYYHIEMFHVAAGKNQALLDQRRMENDYLTSTQRSANIIFKTTFGSDVDAFTIGFHKSIVSFATMPDLSDAVLEKAAVGAGFQSRGDIGLYLRSLIISHQDTLATKVDRKFNDPGNV